MVAVTARTNRSKADQDPAEWLPPASDQYCRYIGEWIGTKLRWGLAVDKVELEVLKTFADGNRHRPPAGPIEIQTLRR
ncbi:hypothetical protein QFZ68_000095 [Streptomyces sp. V1I6]|nr:hypothetical protein [Streptomyces sp. V1I6]